MILKKSVFLFSFEICCLISKSVVKIGENFRKAEFTKINPRKNFGKTKFRKINSYEKQFF